MSLKIFTHYLNININATTKSLWIIVPLFPAVSFCTATNSKSASENQILKLLSVKSSS